MTSWLKHPSPGQRDLLALLSAAVVLFAGSYWVNVFSDLDKTSGFIDAITGLRWKNLAALAALAALALQVLGPRYWRRSTESRYEQQIEPTLERVFKLAINTYVAARPRVLMNGRYFERVKENGRDVLKPKEGVHVERDPMPGQFGLTPIDLVADDEFTVVQAIEKGKPLYNELKPGHTSTYRREKRDQVDPRQRWVCACPVRHGSAPARGVVCLYGKTVPVHDEADEEALLTMASELATTCGRVLDGYGLLSADAS